MRKTDLAYVAGIVDGEGCISMRRRKGGACRPWCCVDIANTNEWLIRWLQFSFGGSIFIDHREKEGQENHKRAYRLRLNQHASYEFLKVIYPYLRIKKPQAEIALEFYQTTFKDGRLRRGTKGILAESEKVIEEAQRILMAKLNKKGRPDTGE